MLYGTLVCVSGDNLGSHSVGGFKGSCTALQELKKGASCVQKANRSSHLANCKLNKG